MTLSEIITCTDTLKSNAYPTSVKLIWLSELDTMIQNRILLLSSADTVTYTKDTPTDTQAVLGEDAIGIYTAYLIAMIELYNGEAERYNNMIALFNDRFSDYMRRHAASCDGREPIVLSAYAIACKYGFSGSEEAWVASLRHDPATVTAAGETLELADNTTYLLENVTKLKMVCPDGHFTCHIMLRTADEGTVALSVEHAMSSDDGFSAACNGELWEISVCDGCVLSHLWEEA